VSGLLKVKQWVCGILKLKQWVGGLRKCPTSGSAVSEGSRDREEDRSA
jgi:hypothetical protein